MDKLLLRWTVIAVGLYLLIYYFAVLVLGVDIWSQAYTIFFELCLCACMTAHGKFHCKYLRWTMYGITASDTLVAIDVLFDIFPVNFIVFVPVILIITGLSTTITLAVMHYFKVRRLKKTWQNQNY